MSAPKYAQRFLALSPIQRRWLPLFLLASFPLWLLTLTVRYRRLGGLIGKPQGNIQFCTLATPDQIAMAWQLARVAAIVSRYAPWPTKCLVQAMLVRMALRCHGVPHVIFVGLRKIGRSGESMASHAWLRVGQDVVAGGRIHAAYKIIGTFSDVIQ